MKIFIFLAVARVAMCGFNSCSEECNHKFIEVDHSADLVGTWTCMEKGYAEAINAIYNNINDTVESIKLSIVMKSSK